MNVISTKMMYGIDWRSRTALLKSAGPVIAFELV
jgi:hypothetical protein